MQKKFRQKNFAKIMLTVIFCNLVFLDAPKAHAWETYVTVPLGVMMKNMLDVIKGIILGAAKKKAVEALQQEATALITGKSSGGPMFVSDWQAYLIKQPQATANLYINDYISKITSGRGSISGYVSNGRIGANLKLSQNYEGVGPGSFAYGMGGISAAHASSLSSNSGSAGNYISQLVAGAKKLTTETPEIKVTYQGNPSQMFSDPKNGFKNLNLYLSGINNPWAFNMNIQSELEKKKAELEKVATAKVVAGQGFPGLESGGLTTSPGILIKDQLSKIQNMGVDVVANATNIQEVVVSLATSMINQTMTQGIGQIQSMVRKEVTAVKSQVSAQINQTVQTQGPGALYKR